MNQATKGECATKKPWLDFVAGAKWEAWHRHAQHRIDSK